MVDHGKPNPQYSNPTAITLTNGTPQKASLMLYRILILVISVFCIAANAAADTPHKPARMNVVLICVDDLRPELNCYGKTYIKSPNIDRLASEACLFRRHYVQAPTCGASRYSLLTGCYGPTGNDALFKRALAAESDGTTVPSSLPGWFQRQGYETVSVGKVSHHPGGRGGENWDNPMIPEMPGEWTEHIMPSGPWQHPRGAMHGLAHGEIRNSTGKMDVFQSEVGPDSIYPDGLIAERALEELRRLSRQASAKPFLLSVGFIRPHLPFGAPQKYLDLYEDTELPPIDNPARPRGRSTWHGSGEFMKYNRWDRDPRKDQEFADLVRKHYAACVSYADAQVGRIMTEIETAGLSDSTIIVLWGDHGWHLGERGVWGKHTLFEESLHSPLIVKAPTVSGPGSATDAIVETIDIFPTICELANITAPPKIDGVSFKPILENLQATGDPAISYWGGKRNIFSMRTDGHRITLHADGALELYAFNENGVGGEDLAEQLPDLAAQLRTQLEARLKKFR